MKIDVLLGLQWGDEGKGKIVDVLAPQYDVIARFQGGPNAGHTLKFNNVKHVLHTVPSGIFRENALNVIGNGVVIDPAIFRKEAQGIMEQGIDIRKKLVISSRAHLILPSHRALDHAYEQAKGDNKIGSTKKGIGPTYTDKIARNGLRVGDIACCFEKKYTALKQLHLDILKHYEYDFDIESYEKEWMEGIEFLKSCTIDQTEYLIDEVASSGKKVLAEGAQGTLLDVEFGSYPFVTSSNTTSAGACTGLGVAPTAIGEVFGIFKAYCTRVGSGPFPTELFDSTGEDLRKIGAEFGSTTGRARRCGWLDMPALKYAIMLNGVTQLIMMKMDVLSEMEEIQVATGYTINGVPTKRIPLNGETVQPVYTTFKGWMQDITAIRTYSELPLAAREYIEYIERETGVPITIVSLGPDRDSTIIRNK